MGPGTEDLMLGGRILNAAFMKLATLALSFAVGVVPVLDLIAAEPHPVIEMETDYLIGSPALGGGGGVGSGKWLNSEAAAKVVKQGTVFRTYSLTRELGTSKGGKPKANADICEDVYTIELTPKPEKGIIALAAPWNALPRAPKVLDTTQPVYIQAVREFLDSHGLKHSRVNVTSILRIDLDGDGEDEVLISATNYPTRRSNIQSTLAPVPSASPAGSYSLVILRRVVDGKVRTQLIQGEFYPKAKTFNAPNSYEVIAVLDLDGDGKLEVVVRSLYYEGGATSIYRCTPAKVEELVTVACGA